MFEKVTEIFENDLHIFVHNITTTIRYKKLDPRNLNLRNGKKFNQNSLFKISKHLKRDGA